VTPGRDDYVPHYRADLMEIAKKVRDVLVNLHKLNIPELANITEQDYDLVRLAAINSIKGQIVAKEERTRQAFVESVFLKPAKERKILSYKDTSLTGKCDFEGNFVKGHHFGLEVKGGEGNSVTLLERPANAEIFVVWSHLDVMSNSPAKNMNAVLARVVKQMINKDEKRQKVDFLIFYDEWYRSGVKVFKSGPPLPDVFVFPVSIPTRENTHPSLPSISSNIFLNSLFDVVGNVQHQSDVAKKHIWLCDIELFEQKGSWKRKMKIYNSFDNHILFNDHEFTTATCKPA
jgi:hypothetical protein